MAVVNYRSTSPYVNTNQFSWYLDILEFRAIPADGTDKIMRIEAKYNKRPDLLSFDEYGTTDYWWVFMIRNPDIIADPINDLLSGIDICVPTLTRLQEI